MFVDSSVLALCCCVFGLYVYVKPIDKSELCELTESFSCTLFDVV